MNKQERLERQEKYLAVLRKHQERLLTYPNVLYLGVGFKNTAGKLTDELAIVAIVDKKLRGLKDEEVIPTEIDGFKTDVQEHQDEIPHNDCDPKNLQTKVQRPNKGGFQITNNITTPLGYSVGTLGCCVKKEIPKTCCCCECGKHERYFVLTKSPCCIC